MLKKLGMLVLGSAVALSLVACGDSTKEASNEKKEEPKQEAKKENKENKESKKKITAADVEAIKVGDSLTGAGGDKYEDIVAKFGEPDNKVESQAGDIKMIIASWTKILVVTLERTLMLPLLKRWTKTCYEQSANGNEIKKG